MIEARLLHDRVGGVTRLDLVVDREGLLPIGTAPDFVVAAPLLQQLAVVLLEHRADLPPVVAHLCSAAAFKPG